MHVILGKVSTVPCAEHVTGFQTKCVLGFFTEPGFRAIESVGNSIKADTLMDIKNASEIFCSGTWEYCNYGFKDLFDLLKHKLVPTMQIEVVRMPAGCNWCDSHDCSHTPLVNCVPQDIKMLPLSGAAIQH